MKLRYLQITWLLIFLSVVSCASTKSAGSLDSGDVLAVGQTAADNSPAPYLLGPGDEVSIRIWRNDDLNRTVKIDPSGNIYLPLAGEIKAAGITIPELRKDIAIRLSKYLVNPQIDVNTTAVSSRKVYVLGEVRSPGTFYLEQNMPPWEAISRAGGFTEDANRDSLLLVRGENGAARVSLVAMNMEKIFNDGGVLTDSRLRNGDILYVPETDIAELERFMKRLNNILIPIITIERGIIFGPQVSDALHGKGKNVIVAP
jgi:polysaccharide export outer membrane protein